VKKKYLKFHHLVFLRYSDFPYNHPPFGGKNRWIESRSAHKIPLTTSLHHKISPGGLGLFQKIVKHFPAMDIKKKLQKTKQPTLIDSFWMVHRFIIF